MTRAQRRACKECHATFMVRPYQVDGSRPLMQRRWHLCLDCDLARTCVSCGKTFKAVRGSPHQKACSAACSADADRRGSIARYHARQAQAAEARRRQFSHPMVSRLDMRRVGRRKFDRKPEKL